MERVSPIKPSRRFYRRTTNCHLERVWQANPFQDDKFIVLTFFRRKNLPEEDPSNMGFLQGGFFICQGVVCAREGKIQTDPALPGLLEKSVLCGDSSDKLGLRWPGQEDSRKWCDTIGRYLPTFHCRGRSFLVPSFGQWKRRCVILRQDVLGYRCGPSESLPAARQS